MSEVAIIGLGLIGGSLARALTREGWSVVGVDRAEVVRRARAARALAAGSADVAAALDVRLIVLAAPPRANLALLRRLAPRLAPGTVVTDLGSVKRPICRLAHELGVESFVGGHPMAGRERSGWDASHADLFRDHPWIVATDDAKRSALTSVLRMVRATGARPHRMSAEEHDRTVAFLSHVPQLVAWALEAAAKGDDVAARHLALAGPGFRDMTRLARSPRPLWREILGQNRGEVARALAALARALKRRV